MRSVPATKPQDPVATRSEIVSAAVGLFSEFGFAATSINDIASKAGVPKSLVLYHFGTKDNLWSQCVEERVRPFMASVQSFLDGEDSDLRGLIDSRFALLRDRPEIPRLLAWMSLDSKLVPQDMQTKARELREKLEAKKLDGNSVEARDPLMFVAVIVSAIDGWFRFREFYSILTGLDGTSPEIEERFYLALTNVAFNKEASS